MSTEITQVETQTPDAADDQRPKTRAFAAPSVDVFESKDAFQLMAELPGVAADSVKIGLEKDELTLEAPRADQPLDFRRRFKLSVPVDGDRVTARLEHGVLRVELPKAEQVKPRSIPVIGG